MTSFKPLPSLIKFGPVVFFSWPFRSGTLVIATLYLNSFLNLKVSLSYLEQLTRNRLNKLSTFVLPGTSITNWYASYSVFRIKPIFCNYKTIWNASFTISSHSLKCNRILQCGFVNKLRMSCMSYSDHYLFLTMLKK